jgi:hypothetical protein
LARKDYYVEDPSRLKGKPKLTIGDYVESAGIPGLYVPRRYATFRTAKREVENGGTVLFRNEHECEYDGPSGLADSIRINAELRYTAEYLKYEKTLDEKGFEEAHKYHYYCNLLGLDIAEFKKGFSYSYWEYIPGMNVAIIADSSIEGRYHLMLQGKRKVNDDMYVIVENGKIVDAFERYYLSQPDEKINATVLRLITLYEQIRNLDNFNPLHCPIMEFQIGDDRKDYFLQYHRTRDFCQSTFTLDDPKPGWIETIFARGATPTSEGRIVRTGIGYPMSFFHPEDGAILKEKEEGCSFSDDCAYNEIRARQRILQIIPLTVGDSMHRELKRIRDTSQRKLTRRYKETIYNQFQRTIVGHANRSALFKPDVSVIQSVPEIVGSESVRMRLKAVWTNRIEFVNIQVISDGKRAFVRRVE